MLKLKSLFFTLALSFFMLVLFKTENHTAFKFNTHSQQIKIDDSVNAFAVITNNPSLEVLSFTKLNKTSIVYFLNTSQTLGHLFLLPSSFYLKICDFLNLNLTIKKIIYPFHSFL